MEAMITKNSLPPTENFRGISVEAAKPKKVTTAKFPQKMLALNTKTTVTRIILVAKSTTNR